MADLKTTGSRASAQKYAVFPPFRVRSITLVAAPGTPGVRARCEIIKVTKFFYNFGLKVT